MKKALIKDRKVINIIKVGGDYRPDDGVELVSIPDSASNAGIGWGYENGSFIDPETVKPISDVRARRLKEVTIIRKSKEKGGFLYDSNTYQVDIEAQKDILAVQTQFLLGATNPHGGFWMSEGNVPVTMDDDEVKAFFQAAFNYIYALKAAAWTHKENLNKLNARNDVLEYDISTGWPKNE